MTLAFPFLYVSAPTVLNTNRNISFIYTLLIVSDIMVKPHLSATVQKAFSIYNAFWVNLG